MYYPLYYRAESVSNHKGMDFLLSGKTNFNASEGKPPSADDLAVAIHLYKELIGREDLAKIPSGPEYRVSPRLVMETEDTPKNPL
jgi:hypothetical protein